MTTAPDIPVGPAHQHTESVRACRHCYTVHVGGTLGGESTRDPVGYGNYGQAWENNLSLRLANAGDTVVVNPRLVVNGRRRWHSVGDVLAGILEDGMSDAQKARAIWEFARRHRYHATTGDDEVKDTVKMLNVYGYTLCWDEAYTVANGRHLYAPRLDAGFAIWAETADNLQIAPSGPGLAPLDAGIPSSLTYRVECPYVLVGGWLKLRLGAAADAVRVEGAGGPSRAREAVPAVGDGDLSRAPVWHEIADHLGPGACKLDLDPCFPPDTPASYCCWVRLTGQLALESLEVELDVQMAPLSLPALDVGVNTVEYEDESEGSRAVTVTHQWLERDECQAPAAPRLTAPASGAQAAGTQTDFLWEPVPGAVDYHIRVSETADLRWVVSPSFEKLTSRTPASGAARWRVPEEGLLNPGQTYHWHVRARNAQGLWGPWSTPASFTPRAPGVPVDVRCRTDWQQRAITLCWQPGPEGTAPVHYEVYASAERGFTASREPYAVVVGGQEGTAQFPANLVGQTTACALVVLGRDAVGVGTAIGPAPPDEPAGGPPPSGRQGVDAVDACFFRVVAVDAAGVRSGPSDYAEAPRPFVYSRPPAGICAGRTSVYLLKATRCNGDLRCVSRGSSRYLAAFRHADQLDFILDEGPAFIALDGATGRMTLRPEALHVGTHTVTVRVHNGQGGTDVQGFDLTVTP